MLLEISVHSKFRHWQYCTRMVGTWNAANMQIDCFPDPNSIAKLNLKGALGRTFVKRDILDLPLQKHEIFVSSGEMISLPLPLV